MRRRVLAFVALLPLVLLAGCSAAGSITMEPVSDHELAERASRSAGQADVESENHPEARLVRTAIENGSATVDSRSPPIRAGRPFAHDGAYYDVSWTVVDRRTATAVDVQIDYNATDPAGQRIAYMELPPPDRAALDALLPPRGERRVPGYDLGAGVTYTDAERARSVLVPAQQYDVVVFRGEPYAIRVVDARAVTINTYRYSATRVANSSAEYARQVTDRYRFALSGLSADERSVVEAAIEDGYYAESAGDDAFASVLERFRAHEAVGDGGFYGEWLVRYDGTVYWAELRYGQFVDGG